jgi:hypothetical protein
MTTRDPSFPGDEAPAFAPDFAEQVLRTVDRRRRRRALGLSLAAAMGALAVALTLPRAQVHGGLPVHHRPAATLEADDFAWLEEAGTEPSTPSELLFPDQAESTRTTATPSEGNLFVAVAENI